MNETPTIKVPTSFIGENSNTKLQIAPVAVIFTKASSPSLKSSNNGFAAPASTKLVRRRLTDREIARVH